MTLQSQMKLKDMLENEDLRPRASLDSVNEARLVDAIEAGRDLPPIVVDTRGYIVDGWMRKRAYIRVRGAEAEVACEVRRYASDAELILDAMTLNSNHGQPLSPWDRLRCMELGERHGASRDAIAAALNMTRTELKRVQDSRMGKNLLGKDIPLKRTLRHMAGQMLTERQQLANDRLSGMTPMFYINQVIELLDADLLVRDEEHTAAVAGLMGSVDMWLQLGNPLTTEEASYGS